MDEIRNNVLADLHAMKLHFESAFIDWLVECLEQTGDTDLTGWYAWEVEEEHELWLRYR